MLLITALEARHSRVESHHTDHARNNKLSLIQPTKREKTRRRTPPVLPPIEEDPRAPAAEVHVKAVTPPPLHPPLLKRSFVVRTMEDLSACHLLASHVSTRAGWSVQSWNTSTAVQVSVFFPPSCDPSHETVTEPVLSAQIGAKPKVSNKRKKEKKKDPK